MAGFSGGIPTDTARRENEGAEVGNPPKPPPEGDPQTYQILFPGMAGPQYFPVKGYRGWPEMMMELRVHLLNRELRDTVFIFD